VKPIPVVFHIGPLQVHTYGIGLALTFWFGYRYFAKRLRDHGYPDAWMGRAFVWIVIMSIVGARAVSVIANLKGPQGYAHNPGDIFAIWHGGLSSYGGLLGGVPTGLICGRRSCPQLRLGVAIDLVAPVLVIAWAVGRLLGPQFEYQGGGLVTHAWYGLAYAGQAGKRIPVPIFQALEDSVVYVIALWVERRIARRGGPIGVVATTVVTLYGAFRFNDEFVLLPHNTGGDFAVLVASIAFVCVGAALAGWLLWRDRGRTHDGITDPWHAPEIGALGAGANGATVSRADAEVPSSLPPESEQDDAQQGGGAATHGLVKAQGRPRVVPGHSNPEKGEL
jgi:prolipoprotein diacylglyceryltransferase